MVEMTELISLGKAKALYKIDGSRVNSASYDQFMHWYESIKIFQISEISRVWLPC